MELSVEMLEGGVRCVRLKGRLDLKGTQEIEARFAEACGAAKQSIVVDMAGIDFIASIGIRLLLSNIKALTAAGARMVIFRPQKLVEDVLKLSGLDTVAPVVHDEAQARQMILGG